MTSNFFMPTYLQQYPISPAKMRQGELVCGTLGLSFQPKVVSQLVCLTMGKLWPMDREQKRRGVVGPLVDTTLKPTRGPLLKKMTKIARECYRKL